MEIVKADWNNYNDCFETHTKALYEGFSPFKPINFINDFTQNYKTYFKEILNNKNFEIWICYDEDTPLGIIIFGKYTDSQQENVGILDSIYFREKFHHKGYSKLALEFIEQNLKQKQFNKIVLWCSKENPRAWKFYKKNGYLPTDKKWDDILDGKIFHNILFEKKL